MEEDKQDDDIMVIDQDTILKMQQKRIQYEKKDYERPMVDQINLEEDFILMNTEIDHYVVKNNESIEDENGDEQKVETFKGIIRIYGINKKGNSVLVQVHNYLSYFYVETPNNYNTDPTNLEELRSTLNSLFKSGSKQFVNEAVLKIEVTEKENIKYYKGSGSKKGFLKVTVMQPGFVSSLRSIFERGHVGGFETLTYESQLPYIMKFMIDKNIVGMGWLRLKAGGYKFIESSLSSCQIELEVTELSQLESIESGGEFNMIAPLRLFSFDIECASKKGFPQEKRDPVIQIASICKIHSDETHFLKTIYTLKECANIVDSEVRCFEDEKDMLKEWAKLIMQCDPDIIIGYNIINFDFPYLIQRAEHLGIKEFRQLGRIYGSESKLKNGKYLSKVMGMRETKEINLEGRIQLDMLMHMHREHKLSSYTLNNVSFQFLNQQKEDVHYSIIYDLQNGSNDSRRRLAIYCLKDALLPLRLCEKLMCIYNYTEMSRVTGVPLNYLLNRGQQIKVASQLYRLAKQQDFVVPNEKKSKGDGSKYEGAFVLDPKQAHYTIPIATLDFASLYPSIMIRHNLCYSTLIRDKDKSKYNEDDYTVTPNNNCFIKPHIRKGILPSILEQLLKARKQAKLELKNCADTEVFLKAVLDGRQLALKISANSVYGFTGAQVGQLPCLEISASVTAFGRDMILKTQQLVLERYNIQNGYQHNTEIVYGDTDSVMVKFGVETVKEAMKLGKEAASYVSQHFQEPIKLEFEKVYYPYLLLNRKRYAGLYWSKEEKWDKVDTKGIESVRRDNCLLIRRMITQILNMILIERDVQKSIHYVQNTIRDLLSNKIDLSNLVITKAITKSSDSTSNNGYKVKQAHVELAQKMKKRDGGNSAAIGDRIAYVMVGGLKGTKNYENAEDPLYVLQNDIPIDYQYYIEKQIKQPLTRIYELILPNVNVLFQGSHTSVQYVPKVSKQNKNQLGQFLKVKPQCLSCKTVVDDSQSGLCSICLPRQVDIFSQKVVELNKLQLQFSELWVECQRCQGGLHQEVLCSNSDCPIFYKRMKVQKQLTEHQQLMDRLTQQDQTQW